MLKSVISITSLLTLIAQPLYSKDLPKINLDGKRFAKSFVMGLGQGTTNQTCKEFVFPETEKGDIHFLTFAGAHATNSVVNNADIYTGPSTQDLWALGLGQVIAEVGMYYIVSKITGKPYDKNHGIKPNTNLQLAALSTFLSLKTSK